VRVDLRDSAAHREGREALPGVVAVLLLELRLVRLLVGFLRGLRRVLLALAERLLLLGRRQRTLLRLALARFARGGRGRRGGRRRDAGLGHGLALHARRTGILPVYGDSVCIEALVDLGLRRYRGEHRECEKRYANHGEIPVRVWRTILQFQRASQLRS